MRHNDPVPVAVAPPDAAPVPGGPRAAHRVLLLAPSTGLGGGIERYLDTVEWALAAGGTGCQRLNLAGSGARASARLLAAGRAVLRADPLPTRLVVGHRALLPVAALLARERPATGMTVLCYGNDAWGPRHGPRRRLERRLMRGPGVRLVAISGFTAGALSLDRPAAVLPPALSAEWFGTLAAAAARPRPAGAGVRLLTTFRLADWRDKGLPEILAAVAAQRRSDIRLRVCGSGQPPGGLVHVVRQHPWCSLRAGLTDRELAAEYAAADLFVLATRTRTGRQAYGEGFGFVLLEAQAAGTPVIVPAHGGSHDAYAEGVTGAAPADETAAALAAVLARLLRDPARLATMGTQAARWARETFDPARYPALAASRLL